MPSDVDICNLALMRLGTRSSISSLSEGSAEAAACAQVYPIVRDSLLTLHPWGFASRRVGLADLGSPPDPWGFRYAWPTDCLRARAIHQPLRGGPVIPFRVAGDQDAADNPIRVILTDQFQAELSYTAQITLPALFDSLFVEALSWMLAAELAIGLTGDKGLAQSCQQAAAAAVASARSDDANQSSGVTEFVPEALSARGYSDDWRGRSCHSR